ncbi:putative lipid II flippase FtsW [Candidatus Dependentiae bacterium]|nr:putative lipid II flippase FtsW [Candidatus Dependentiae bacterium]
MIVKHAQTKIDLRIFIGITVILILIGCLFIYSASSVYALETFGFSHYFIKKQLFGLSLGIVGFIIARFTPLNLIKKLSPLLFIGTLSLTALTLIPIISYRIHGSSRWLNIAGFSFQPSELLKIAFVLYIAYFLSKRERRTISFARTYLPFLVIIGITSIILLQQPDFGLTITLATTAITLLFIGQFHAAYLSALFATCIPLVITLILIKPYRIKRILTFLNPWNDPQGAGFQIIQSLIAIGSGSFCGIGISNSKQKFFYLPMQHTDFIFSIIAEETGFIGSLLLISLYMLFTYFGMKLAWQMKDSFCIFATLGFIILISLQTIINLAVTTGLAPTKGIGLPFVSYGNTSLVCIIFMIGLIINMAYYNMYSSY